MKMPFWMIYLAFFCLTHRYDVIVPENLDTLMPTWVVAKLCRKKIIYDVADFYADGYIPGKLGVLRRLVANLEIFLIKRVDAVIIPNDSVKHQIGNVDGRKVFVIYNTPEDIYENLCRTAGYDNAVSEFADNNFIIFYGGGIFSDRGLHELVQAIDGINDTRLLIAGFGAAEKELKEIIKDRSNVLFLGRLDHAKILELTYLSNCIVILYDPLNPNIIHASPNKLFEAMMCGKPIIAIKGTFMAEVVKQEKCGLLIDSKDAEKLRITIDTLRENPAFAAELGNNGRKAYNAKYNWSIMERTLLTLLETIFDIRGLAVMGISGSKKHRSN